MNELLRLDNKFVGVDRWMQNTADEISKFCPVTHFVTHYLEGLCTPIANYVYQMVRPENLLDLFFGAKVIDKKVIAYQKYQAELSKMEQKAKEAGVSLSAPCRFLREGTNGTAGRGIEIVVDTTTRLLFCLKPQTIKNHIEAFERALNFIEAIRAQHINSTAIELGFLEVYQALEIAHQYRQKNLIVSEYEINNPDRFHQLLLNQGFTEKKIQKSYALAEAAYDRSNQIFGDENHVQFPEEYKTLMKDILYFPPSFLEVPKKMEHFLKSLRNKLKEVDKLGITDSEFLRGIAAWAHQEIIKIHPFEDGNGRIARLIMNAILKCFNLMPIVFLSDKEYVQAVKNDIKAPGVFAHYLSYNATQEMENNANLSTWDKQPSIIKRISDWAKGAYANKQIS